MAVHSTLGFLHERQRSATHALPKSLMNSLQHGLFALHGSPYRPHGAPEENGQKPVLLQVPAQHGLPESHLLPGCPHIAHVPFAQAMKCPPLLRVQHGVVPLAQDDRSGRHCAAPVSMGIVEPPPEPVVVPPPVEPPDAPEPPPAEPVPPGSSQ